MAKTIINETWQIPAGKKRFYAHDQDKMMDIRTRFRDYLNIGKVIAHKNVDTSDDGDIITLKTIWNDSEDADSFFSWFSDKYGEQKKQYEQENNIKYSKTVEIEE